MKAITFHNYGGSQVLGLQEVELPNYNEQEVLIELYATSVNPVDSNIRAGRVQDVFPVHSFPHILGLDLAGVVKEVGAAVKGLKPGDRVFGLGKTGTYAQYAVADESQIAKLSDSISYNEAGALPAVALTAWHSLFQYGQLKDGEHVLIHGGAGGVGHVAIQMAKLAGAYVSTTASLKNHDFVKSLGADQVIDYVNEDFSEIIGEVDMVLDLIVGLNQDKNCKVLKQEGRIISIVTPHISEQAQARGRVGEFVFVDPKRDQLEEIERWMQDGKLKVQIDELLPLEEVAVRHAHNKIETKHTRGKIVFQIRD